MTTKYHQQCTLHHFAYLFDFSLETQMIICDDFFPFLLFFYCFSLRSSITTRSCCDSDDSSSERFKFSVSFCFTFSCLAWAMR